ncbi:hypothetical protein FB451DRAFT_1372703 [Mycena latifolia]|nr:hypothetical protein FB451DRAFT_1372703 [Mycena latifolia]
MDPTLDTLISQLQAVAYVKASSLTLLAYDTMIHLDQEYTHVWASKWTFIKCLYLWTRYGTFVDTILAFMERLNIFSEPSTCKQIMSFDTIFSSLGIALSEIILMMRTYALYGRPKLLLVFYMIVWIVLVAVNAWALTQWSVQASPSASSACFMQSSSGVGLVGYVSLLSVETVVVILTVLKGIQTFSVSRPGQHTPLLTGFYRDGILFYLSILPMTILAIAVVLLAPPGLNLLADT